MIFKRPRYRKDGQPRIPIKSIDQISGLILYLKNPDHRNHAAVTIGKLQHWPCDSVDLVSSVEKSAEAYRLKPKGRGAPWKGEIAEHVIYAPPEGIWLTDAERTAIAGHLVPRISPDSPAVYIWHQGVDGRDELHILTSNFTSGEPPELRITAIRNDYDGDYLLLAMEFGRQAIAIVNESRAQRRLAHPTKDTPSAIPTLAEIRVRKREAAGFQTLPEILFQGLGPFDCLDRTAIVDLLRSRGWDTRSSKKHISVTPPEKVKARRWPWDTLLLEIQLLREALLKAIEKEREDAKEKGKDNRNYP